MARRRARTWFALIALWFVRIFFAVILAFPFYWMLITMFKRTSDLYNLKNNPFIFNEAPTLERSWRSYRGRGVALVGIAIQDKQEASQKFISDFSLSFPNAPDPDGKVSVDYGVYGVPETFFIDRTGRIRRKHAGPISDELFRTEVEKLLGEPAHDPSVDSQEKGG